MNRSPTIVRQTVETLHLTGWDEVVRVEVSLVEILDIPLYSTDLGVLWNRVGVGFRSVFWFDSNPASAMECHKLVIGPMKLFGKWETK